MPRSCARGRRRLQQSRSRSPAPRAELGHLEALRGDPGPRRRLDRARAPGRSTRSSGRTAPARAPSSRSWQACTSRTPGRIARRRRDAHSTARRPPDVSASPSSPGAASLPRPDGCRERVHGPRAARPFASTGARCAAGPGRSSTSWASMDSTALVRGLSMADQQLIEIAKALSFDARVLILDEPTASLSAHEVERLFTIVRPDARFRCRGAVREPPPRGGL